MDLFPHLTNDLNTTPKNCQISTQFLSDFRPKTVRSESISVRFSPKNSDLPKPKNWIKNKDIGKYIINNSQSMLIYSNDIKNEEEEEFLVETFLKPYKQNAS